MRARNIGSRGDSKSPGPSCSKLKMSLVNVSLKLWHIHFAAFAKATHIFLAKIPVNKILH